MLRVKPRAEEVTLPVMSLSLGAAFRVGKMGGVPVFTVWPVPKSALDNMCEVLSVCHVRSWSPRLAPAFLPAVKLLGLLSLLSSLCSAFKGSCLCVCMSVAFDSIISQGNGNSAVFRRSG